MTQNTSNKHISKLKEDMDKGQVSRREFVKLATTLGVSATAAYGMAGLPFVNDLYAASHKKGDTLKIGSALQELKDPANMEWVESSNVNRMVCEYLTEVDPDNVVRPFLAESWEASDDLTQWRFKLRKGVKFNNGDDFDVSHVEFNFKRWTDEKSKSVNKSQFSHLKKFEVVNSHEFVLHLSSPDLAIPEKLYEYPTSIVHKDFDKNGSDIVKFPVGTGPCNLKSFKVGDKAVLEERSGYWGKPVHFKRFEFIDLGTDDQAYINALAAKQVDIVYHINSDFIKVVDRLKHLQVFEAQTSQTAVIRMKVGKKPFDNPKIRQAITLCADNKEMLKVAIKGNGTVAENHHVSPNHPEYYKLPPVRQDIKKAKQLLKEAGHPNGIEVECIVGNTQGKFEQDTVIVLKQQCAKAGITINIKVMPAQQYWPIWDKADFSLTFWANRPLGIMIPNLAYRSNAVWNETNYSNPKYDAALAKASGIIDPKKRSLVMKDVEKILQDDNVIIQPYWRKLYAAGNKNLGGFRLHPAQYMRYDRVYLT